MIVQDSSLRAILESDAKVFWAGKIPPLARMQASERIFDPLHDFRMPPTFHQSFQLVYLVERDLGTIKAWPLVVDEALRLLTPGGILIIRMTNTKLCSIFELKHQLYMWGHIAPQFEFTDEDGATQFAVKNTRTTPRLMGADTFTFGVITDGKRQGQLFAFIASVLALDHSAASIAEIVVCGPLSIEANVRTAFPTVVFVVDTDEFVEQGWITRKKNQIVDHAQYENVIIAHDRYTIKADFITCLQAFGGDFSFLVCRQLRPDGRRFPDWVALGCEWSWSPPAMLEYGDWTRNMYINGGIMIAKTRHLKQTRWNELLFWNQAEDVELTRRLRSQGHVPRLARAITVCSTVTRDGTMESFEPMPSLPDRYHVSGPPAADGEIHTPSLPYAQQVRFGHRWGRASAEMGVYVDSAFTITADSVRLEPGIFGEIAFMLADRPTHSVELWLAVPAHTASLEIVVNDIVQHAVVISPTLLRVALPKECFALSRVCRLHLRSHIVPIAVSGLKVQPTGWMLGVPLPMTRQGARDLVTHTNLLSALDGASLCVCDLQTLARGARRFAVVMPPDRQAQQNLTPFLTALRRHARPDAIIRLLSSARTELPNIDCELQTIDWQQFAADGPYLLECIADLNAFAPELLINGFSSRTLLSDVLVLESNAVGVIGFERRSYELAADEQDFSRPKYTRLIEETSGGVADTLIRALDLSADVQPVTQ